MDFKLFIFSWFYQCLIAVCDNTYFNVLRINIDDIVSSVPEDETNVKSLLDCTRRCSRAKHCMSVFYSKEAKGCRMNNNSVILRDDAEIPFFASYLVLVPLSQNSWSFEADTIIEQSVETTTTTQATEVTTQRPRPQETPRPGITTTTTQTPQIVSASIDPCSTCMVLENKFSPYPGMALAGFDEFKIYLTLAECLQACIDEQGFTCLSADYMPETLACHLDSRSHCMAPELFVPVSSMNHYHRECIQD